MKNAMNGFWSVAAKELLHLRRDPITLVFALLIPLVQLMLFGYAVDFDVRHVRTVVVDMDRSRESREYLASLHNTQYIDVVETVNTPDDAIARLRTGIDRAAIIIPPDFARNSRTGRRPQIRVLLDGSDVQVAVPAQRAFMRPPDSTSATVDARINVLFNPAMQSRVYTIPGLIGVILQLVTVSLTSFSLVREREQGTLDQLMVSPVGIPALMLGKLAPYSLIAMAEIGMVLVLGHFIFGTVIVGSLGLLLLLTVPFVLAALSMGLLISTIAQNQAQALQMTLLLTMPTILLSGYVFPRETMPGALYILSDLLPVTYFLQILRGVIVRGAGFTDLWPSMAALLAITTLLLVISTTRFHKSVG